MDDNTNKDGLFNHFFEAGQSVVMKVTMPVYVWGCAFVGVFVCIPEGLGIAKTKATGVALRVASYRERRRVAKQQKIQAVQVETDVPPAVAVA